MAGRGETFSAMLDKIHDLQKPQVDLSEILVAVEKSKRDVKLELSSVKSLIDSASRTVGEAASGNAAGPAQPPLDSTVAEGSSNTLHQAISPQLDGNSEQLQKKVSSDHKLAMIELHKILAVLDGIMDMSSSRLDLSPVLEAIARLDMQPPDVNLSSIMRAITEVSTSLATVQMRQSQAGKMPTEDDFVDLRQILLASLRDLEVNGEQLQEKVDNLEERLISRMNSNHKLAMFELQKTTNAQMLESTRHGSVGRKDGLVKVAAVTKSGVISDAEVRTDGQPSRDNKVEVSSSVG